MSPSYELQTTENGISYLCSGPAGSNTCLVCIHGWACQATDYTGLLDELRGLNIKARAIAINLPGNGKSSTQQYPVPTISNTAAAVLSVVQELQLKNIVLVGHSMGVRVVLECWRQLQLRSQTYSEHKVIALVFLDGSHYKLRKTLFAFDKADARSKALSKDEKIAGMSEAFKRMFSEHTPEDFRAATLQHLKTMDLEYNEALRAAFINWDHEHMDDTLDALGKSGIPLISVTSTDIDEDNNRIPMEPFEISKWMRLVKEKVPQARLAVVREVMHFPHVDAPDTIAKILKRFLEWDLEQSQDSNTS